MLGVHQQPLTHPTDRVHSARGLPNAPNAKRLKQPLLNALIRTTVRSDRTAVHPKRGVIVPVPPNLFLAPVLGKNIRGKRLLRHRTERKIAYKIGNRHVHNVTTATKEDVVTSEGVTNAPLASAENIAKKAGNDAKTGEKIGARIALHPMPPSIPTSRPLLGTRPSGARTGVQTGAQIGARIALPPPPPLLEPHPSSVRSTRTDTLRSGSVAVTKKKIAWQEKMGDAQIGERIALPPTRPLLGTRPSGARTARTSVRIALPPTRPLLEPRPSGARTGATGATVMLGVARTAISMD